MKPMATTCHIGTCGWHYPHWRGRFYPDELSPADWLARYARDFATVEVNASFYRLLTAATVRSWAQDTPAGFVFALKASRFITHMKKLRAPRRSTRALLRVARWLGTRCGPILFQLPPRWRCDLGRLAAFLRALLTDYRYAFEFRDRSWLGPELYALLRRHGAAFCIHDLAGREAPHVLTADFAYVRLHGPAAYRGSYPDAALRAWAREIRGWRDVQQVYVYFNNDEDAHAVRNALALRSRLEASGARD